MIASNQMESILSKRDKQRLLDENIHLKQELRERYDFTISSPIQSVATSLRAV